MGAELEQFVKESFAEFKGQVAKISENKVDRAELDDVRAKLDEVVENTAEVKGVSSSIEKLRDRLDELEADRKSGAQGSVGDQMKSWIDVLTEQAEKKGLYRGEGEKKAWVRAPLGNTEKLSVPSVLWPRAEKKATTLDSDLVGDWPTPVYRTGLISARARRLGFLSTLNRVEAPNTEVYKYKRETSASKRGYVHSTLDTALTSSGSVVSVVSAKGFVEETKIRVHSTDSVDEGTYILTISAGGVDTGSNNLTVDETISFDADIGDHVTSEVYGMTAESTAKPYMLVEVEEVTETMQTIAILLAMTQQRLNTIPALQSWVRTRMARNMRQVLTWHALYGSGSTGQLQGLFEVTGANQCLWSEGALGDNRIDAMLRTAEEVEAEGYNNINMLLNPRDFGKLRRLKGADEHYLMSNRGPIQIQIAAEANVILIDRYPAVLDDVVKVGDFAAYDPVYGEWVDQMSAAFALGYVNDQFEKNEITARYEETVLHAIQELQAFCLGQWDNAPT